MNNPDIRSMPESRRIMFVTGHSVNKFRWRLQVPSQSIRPCDTMVGTLVERTLIKRQGVTMINDVVMTVSTYPTREKAMEVARALVEKRLAACVQVTSPVTSIYSWEGKIHEDSEVLLFIKTTYTKNREVIKFIKKDHPYQIPEIVTFPLADGLDRYLDWVRESTV